MHPDILKLIDDKNLVSAMNRTKWDQLALAITADSDLEPVVRLKELNQPEPAGAGFWHLDWEFWEFDPVIIEWIDINPIKKTRLGALVPDLETNVSNYIRGALARSNVPYSMEDGMYRVWGYYDLNSAPSFVSHAKS